MASAAAPRLQIVGAQNPGNIEQTGDAGGTSYAVAQGTYNGPGVPSALGGWPTAGANGFAADTTFGGALGTSGFHSAYLDLDQAAPVVFQFMGSGNSALVNHFYLDLNHDSDYTDPGEELFRGKTTTACTVSGCNVTSGGLAAGQNQYTFNLAAGRIWFAYESGNGVLIENSGAGNGNPNPHTTTTLPGYFLGVDPYLATGTYQTSGTTVYAGFSDLPNPGDHDFQDMGVRVTAVPEPGSVALFAVGFAALSLRLWRFRKA
jgi:hypothetical protein